MQPRPRLNDPAMEADLERDGYAVTEAFVDASEIAALAEVFATHDVPIHRAAFSASILSDDVAYRTAVDRELKAILKPKVNALFNGYRHCLANFVAKTPVAPGAAANAGEVMIHQDIAFVDESRYQSLGIWIPLMDVDTSNGCVWALPGSHRFNPGPRGPGTPYPYREMDPLLYPRLRPIPMKAGSLMVFCQKLFHASRPNHTATTRVAVGGLLVPQAAQLYCYYAESHAARRIEVFAVDDLFYTRYQYRSRPEGVQRVGTIDYWYQAMDRKQLPG